MCEMCLVEPTEFGEIIPTFYLALGTKDGQEMKSGQYAIIDGEHAVAVFPEKPWPDPFGDMTEEAIEAVSESDPRWGENHRWLAAVEKFAETCLVNPELGHELYEGALKAGFDRERHGWLTYWLYDRAGRMLVDNPKGKTWAEQLAEHNQQDVAEMSQGLVLSGRE